MRRQLPGVSGFNFGVPPGALLRGLMNLIELGVGERRRRSSTIRGLESHYSSRCSFQILSPPLTPDVPN